MKAAEPWMPENYVDPRQDVWERCSLRSSAGETYLRARGLDGVVLAERGLVRFHPKSNAPMVPLFDLAIGAAMVNVVRRSLPRDVTAGAPKTFGMRECPTMGTLVGNVDDIRQGGEVVVVEGVIDSLTAASAWPHATVLGAHGALRIPDVVEEAAARARAKRARLLLAVHADETGTSYAREAALRALKIGMRLDRDLLLVDHGDAKDLNDAWVDGWRPS